MQEFAEQEERRLRTAHEQKWRQAQAEQREAQKQRLLSGVDCKWTPLEKSSEVFCRMNGRLFRLIQGTDKRWSLYRVQDIEDQKGALLGQYAGRSEATKIVAKIAYQPEPRW